jgi:PKD repeat protein
MMKTLYLNLKKLTLIFVCTLLANSISLKSSAQTIVEGFDDITTLTASGWNMQNLSSPAGVTNWFQGNDLVFESYNGALNSYIGANYNNCGGAGTISNWLITPNRTFNNGDAFSFFTRKADPDLFADRLQVRLSTNGASTNVGATATSVGDFTNLILDINAAQVLGVYPIVWTEYSFTISGLAGPTSGRIAFRYFVTNGGPSGANSDYIGIDQFVYSPICTVTIPPNAIAEAEVCNTDVNGGCNSGIPVYQDITCGTTVSGTAWWDGVNRDTDWFRFTVTAATTATITASAEFMYQLFIVDISLGCASLAVVGTGATGDACELVTYSEALAPGTYVAFISPQFDVPTFSCANNPRRNYYLGVTMTVTTPTITPSGPLSFCPGGSVTLTSSADVSYLWSDSSTTQAINVTASGNYTVTTSNVNGCPATSAPTTVTVFDPPSVVITGLPYACTGGSTILTASATPGSSGIATYQWQESNVDIVGETDSTYSASTAGDYTVIVTDSNGCSTTSANVAFTIANNPTVSINEADTTVCAGITLTSTATAGSGTISYQWQESNVDISGATDSTYMASATGSYTVIVTNSFGCTATSSAVSVTVVAAPVVSITGASSVCVGDSTTLTASATAGSGNITGYQWQESSVDISGETDSTYVATTSGMYTVIVTNSNGCSTTSASFTFTVSNNPAISINEADTTVCAGIILTSTATAGSGTITGYQWQESSVDLTGETDSTLNVTASGSYTVVVTNSFGCTATSAAVSVTVNAAPTVSISGATYICAGDSATLTASAIAGSGNITSYQWQESSVDITGATDSTYNASTAGNYTVIVTNSNGCSTTSLSFSFTVENLPTVSITGAAPVCAGDSVMLTASSGDTIATYQWQLNGSDIVGANDSTYQAMAAGDYTVIVTNSAGCSATSSIATITVLPLPVAGYSFTVIGDSVSFTNTSADGISYSWDFDDGSPLDTNASPSHIYTANGSYDVILIVTNSCGSDTITQTITITTIGIQDALNAGAFHVYPNPVSEMLNIDMNVSSAQDVTISIINSLGQVKYSEMRNVSGNSNLQIDVSDLARGYYTLQVAGNQSVSHTKFIIQ